MDPASWNRCRVSGRGEVKLGGAAAGIRPDLARRLGEAAAVPEVGELVIITWQGRVMAEARVATPVRLTGYLGEPERRVELELVQVPPEPVPVNPPAEDAFGLTSLEPGLFQQWEKALSS